MTRADKRWFPQKVAIQVRVESESEKQKKAFDSAIRGADWQCLRQSPQ
jgi:hypothetical protein